MHTRFIGLLALTALAGARPAVFLAAPDAPTVAVRRIPNGGFQPDLAVGHDGTIHLVYFTGDPAGGNLFYVRTTDGGATFSAPVRVNTQASSAIATGTIRGAQIAVAPDGRVHVAWNGSDRAMPRGLPNPKTGRPGSPMLYARSNASRTAFEPQRNLMTHTYNLDGGGTLAADDEGGVYVAWHGNDVKGEEGEAQRRVWLARSMDGGATFAPETAAWSEPTGACGCCGMRLLATARTLRILYRSATAQINRDIFSLVSSDRGRTFQGRRLHEWDINACPMTSMSLAAHGSTVLGAWETDGQVYFTELGGGSTARIVSAPRSSAGAGPGSSARAGSGASAGAGSRAPSDVGPGSSAGAGLRASSDVGPGSSDPGQPERRKHPRLAIDKDGRVLFAWTEGMAWAKGGSLAWQVYGAEGQPIGAPGARPDVPVWSMGVVAARPGGGFVVFY